MVMEEGSPGLALLLRWSSSPHILLDHAFTHTNTQLEQFPADPLRPPQAILRGHGRDQPPGLFGDAWLSGWSRGFGFPDEPETLPVPAEKCLGLNTHESAPPGTKT